MGTRWCIRCASECFTIQWNWQPGGEYVTEDGRRVSLGDGRQMERDTEFYTDEIHLQGEMPERTGAAIEVVSEDCLLAGIRLKEEGYNPAILNMASRRTPGGGVLSGSGAQEETLFRRTDLYRSLYQFVPYAEAYGVTRSVHQYPLDRNFGGIYSPGAIIFRESEQRGYRLMDTPVRMDFISVAGMNRPDLTPEGWIAPHHIGPIKNKMRTILRVGLLHGHDALVLSALGCGAFRNPPRHVARLFHEVLDEEEFRRKFRLVLFAIIDDQNAHRTHNPEGNYLPFVREFQGMGRR